MKLTILYKLSLSAVILVLIAAGTVGGLFYSKTTELLVQQAAENLAGETRSTGARIKAHIDALQNDVQFLINTPPIQGMLRADKTVDRFDEIGHSSYQQWARRLETIFKTMLNAKRTYLNIRIIDINGQEQVVVSRNAGEVVVLKGDQLQDKAHRDYVRETLKLPDGSIYLSEFNLNREFGKIEVPHRQVLRSATPIYDKQLGEVTGLLIITAEVSYELREIQNQIQDESNKIYITNDHGGYLLHPDPGKAYGFNLGKRYRIQEDFPRLAELYLPGNQDNNIILLPDDTGGKNVMNFIKISFDPLHPERFIAVGITELYSNILAKETAVLNEVLLLSVAMVIIVTILSIVMSYRLAHPIKQITRVMDDYTNKRVSNISMPTNQRDEIGKLALSYETLIAQVEDAQSSLEQKVRERTTDLLEARDEAERANVAKSEFLSRMSHELRTPMNAILGFAQMLELDGENFNEIQRGNVKEILEAGQHLLSLINEVLDLSRIESGKMEVAKENVHLDEVLQQCIKLMDGQRDACKINLIDHVSNNNYLIKADIVRLKQVLLNLLSNAVKYNCDHGQITLSAEEIDNKYLRINISDTGNGLTEEEIRRLFIPFDRLDEINNVEGTGIGLVITKHLVELMGGNMGVDSLPGAGSTFWVEFDRVL